MAECEHLDITRTDAYPTTDTPEWKCAQCDVLFLPVNTVSAVVEQEIERIMQITSGLLFDFHTRAVDHYGPQVADALKPPSCAQTGDHSFSDGVCEGCGASQFLGG